MLEGLNEVPWKQLTHAYGRATDVPRLLRQLASPDAKVREKARWDFYGNIWHQGTVYEATAYAVPFLIELLQHPPVQDKEWILVYLADLASGSSYNDVHQDLEIFEDERESAEFQEQLQQELQWVQAARDAVRAGCPVYRELLRHDAREVRMAAAYLLGNFPEAAGDNLPHLLSRYKEESDEAVRAAVVFAVGMLAGGAPGAAEFLKGVISSDDARPVKIAAALGLPGAVPHAMPPEAIELLTEGAANPGTAKDVFERFPWGGTDVQAYCSHALAALGPAASQGLPAMIAAMQGVAPYQTWGIAHSMLAVAFGGKPIREDASFDTLSPDQRLVLQAIADSDSFWVGEKENTTIVNVTDVLDDFGLPLRRKRLRAFIEGKISPKDEEWARMF